ncbi:MAG: hypothetical protein ACXWPM_06360, partial [Bdellovibrionota bacterium]
EVYPLTTLPESGTTQDFYRQTAAANCQNVCVSAFTTADPDYMQERGSSPGTTKMIGPPLRAILSSKEEANIQRTRIREASTRYRALWEEKIKSFDRLQRQENALIDKFRQLDSISVSSGKVSDPLHRLDEAGQDLLLRYSRMMEEILLKTEDFYSGQVTWNDLHEQISGPVIQLQSKFESYCVTGALSQGWKWICDHKTIPAFNSIEVLRSRTKNIGQVDREIIRLWASPK